MVYIGLDLHARCFSMAVMQSDGTVVFETTRSTSSDALREAVGLIGGPKQVVLEESTMARWACRVLASVADRVVAADPWENRQIGRDEKLDDREAARKLADLLRGGYIHPVHHGDEAEEVFKELVLAYHAAGREAVRFKNKLKAKFRQHGMVVSGRQLYRAEAREGWHKQLKSSSVRLQVDLLWANIDHFEKQRERLRRALAQDAGGVEVVQRFQQVPGVGLIRAATFYAIIQTPHRFAHRRRLWTYCGVGLARRQSANIEGPVHLTSRFNRYLKAMAKGAAVSAIAAGDNRYAEQFARLTKQEGTAPEKARLTVARSILSTLYGMWRNGTSYRPSASGSWKTEAAHSEQTPLHRPGPAGGRPSLN